MKINDIAHLCGYFSTSDSGFAEKIAADPFWTPCLHTPEEVENGSKYYFPEFVDLCMVKVKTFRHEFDEKIQVKTRGGEMKSALLTDIHVYVYPFGMVLYSIGLRQDDVLITDSFDVLMSARMLVSMSGDSDFVKVAIAPLDALRKMAGAENLLESGNKFKIFRAVVVDSEVVDQQEFDGLLFSAGTMTMYDEADSMSFTKSYFESILSKGRLAVFRNWASLSILDTYTILAFQPKEFMLKSWENDYFSKLYLYSLFRKFFLFRLNNSFREGNVRISRLKAELESFESAYSFPMVSYNFLPELVVKSMEAGLDIDYEKEKISVMVTREKDRKEAETNDRMNLFLVVISFLTLFSAIWDFGCLMEGMHVFGDTIGSVEGFRACTMLIVGLVCLVVFLTRKFRR